MFTNFQFESAIKIEIHLAQVLEVSEDRFHWDMILTPHQRLSASDERKLAREFAESEVRSDASRDRPEI